MILRVSPRSLVLPAILALAACDLPHDPGNTLEQIRGSIMRVGVIENPPWAIMTPTGPQGVEPALLRELAAQLDASIDWVTGPEQELMQALEHQALDIVIGGITDDNPWAERLGKTKAYHSGKLLVAAKPGAPPLHSLDGAEVAVSSGSAAAGMLISKNARPLPPESSDWQYAVIPDWQLPAAELHPTGQSLEKARRVMLTAKGENAWLVTLERFLSAEKSRVGRLLRDSAHAHP